ncbi:MAG: MarR family transcriptional regulator [Acetobacteraceae bacterium]|nr:MarR family transcriptional regulator [Acetobacteraceae bacterium]MCX7685998.1 MarR family transcriptional regulator [Acetobacteraceae bacterium]MDW8397532.1 MarR family transcriptional regulator [Acetobacteraceae bacterium]
MADLEAQEPDLSPGLLPFALNRLMAAWNARLAARLADIGLSFAQWRVLLVCARARTPPTIVELSDRTLVPHSTLSRQLTEMERLGLVARGPAEDGRAVSIRLTDAGLARYRLALPLAEAETAAGLAGLTPQERALLSDLVARMWAQVREG